jgi:hypothetical protein
MILHVEKLNIEEIRYMQVEYMQFIQRLITS